MESDAGQVTVNERFALFFPEKRPFFLEGIELFGSPQTLVYTRRIVDPKAGAKLTGKFGQLGVAHLTAVDETGAGDAWFNITRLRRDFGRNSIAGLTFTNRDQTGVAQPRPRRRLPLRLGAVLHPVPVRLVLHQRRRGQSATRRSGRRNTTARAARWGFNYLLNGLGRGFDDAGGVREPAPERRGQRARLQPAHPSTARAGRRWRT